MFVKSFNFFELRFPIVQPFVEFVEFGLLEFEDGLILSSGHVEVELGLPSIFLQLELKFVSLSFVRSNLILPSLVSHSGFHLIFFVLLDDDLLFI